MIYNFFQVKHDSKKRLIITRSFRKQEICKIYINKHLKNKLYFAAYNFRKCFRVDVKVHLSVFRTQNIGFRLLSTLK